MAFGSVILGTDKTSTYSARLINSKPVDIVIENMLSSESKHVCTLKTENENFKLDSDCFNLKEAINMSKTTKRSKTISGVYQRGNTWSYTIYPIDVETGKKKQKWVCGFKSQKAAVESLLRARAEIAADVYVPCSSMTLEKYLTTWFERYKKTLQPSTVQGYWNNIKLHILPAIGNVPLSKLDRIRITDFCYSLQAEGLSPRTIKYIFSTLRKALI